MRLPGFVDPRRSDPDALALPVGHVPVMPQIYVENLSGGNRFVKTLRRNTKRAWGGGGEGGGEGGGY